MLRLILKALHKRQLATLCREMKQAAYLADAYNRQPACNGWNVRVAMALSETADRAAAAYTAHLLKGC